MSGRYPLFDRSKVMLYPLGARTNDLQGDFILPLERRKTELCEKHQCALDDVANAMQSAKIVGANTIFMCGGHVLRSGVQNYLFELMEQGYVDCVAVNGAVAIHDFEIALQHATTESVAKYISTGQFGLWEETGRINDILKAGVDDGLGFGEALGREIDSGNYPYKDQSLFVKAWRLGIPVTVHVGVGYDIIHAHPNCDGSVLGEASYHDFLIFAKQLEALEGGCLCTFGSAVMAPEVFLKALAMVRNVALQTGKKVQRFTSLVCDLLDIPQNAMAEALRSDPRYYFRPWKTLLARTVADGGRSYYVQGRHVDTIPFLWERLCILNKATFV